MERNGTRTLPRWMFVCLSVGGAWASGIYLGKLTVGGPSAALLIPLIGFGTMALLMTWGALSVD